MKGRHNTTKISSPIIDRTKGMIQRDEDSFFVHRWWGHFLVTDIIHNIEFIIWMYIFALYILFFTQYFLEIFIKSYVLIRVKAVIKIFLNFLYHLLSHLFHYRKSYANSYTTRGKVLKFNYLGPNNEFLDLTYNLILGNDLILPF